MTAAEAHFQPWPRRRWVFAILLVTAAQLGFILWLGQRRWPTTASPGPSPSLKVATGDSLELLALENPTLFALPHVRSFSGPAWIQVPLRPAPNFDWTEAPRLMTLPVEQLGNLFAGFIATNLIGFQPGAFRVPPPPTMPPPAPLEGFPTQSTVRIEGNPGSRSLLTPLAAPSWPNAELLTPTVVQLLIDSRGWPASIALLSSSGRGDVDQFALQQARTARFEPLLDREPEQPSLISSPLSWIQLVFDWHTLPAPFTNGVIPLP